MPEEPEPKHFDVIAKTEALLEAPIFSKLTSFGFYVEFILRHFYGISFGNFATFTELRDFVTGIRPLSLVLIAAGAAVVPRLGRVTYMLLQLLLFNPTYYFRKARGEELDKLSYAGQIMLMDRAEELAYRKKDDYLLKRCKGLKEEEQKITITKINIAAVFAVAALDLIAHRWQPGAGFIMRSLGVQLALLLATGIYAGIYPPDDYDWVWVPEGYTEEEIHSSRFQRTNKPPILTGKADE